MSPAEVFFDSNVLLYLLSSEDAKADRVEALLRRNGVISVQVLNEVAAGRCRSSWPYSENFAVQFHSRLKSMTVGSKWPSDGATRRTTR